MISRDQWRRFIDHPVVEWTLFVVGILLIIVALLVAPIPGPGGSSFFVAGPCAGPQDEHVGEAPLCPLQALAAQGGPLDRLGACAAERAKRREAARARRRGAAGSRPGPAIDFAAPLHYRRARQRLPLGRPFFFRI